MAITNEQVLSEISKYRTENGRPCPAKHLVETFGAEVGEVIDALKASGTLIGKRGRTGGLVQSEDVAPSDDAVAEDNSATDNASTSVAEQFAALAAKLAAEDAAVSV